MSERNFGNLRAQRWGGDEWPEKRVSIADVDTGHAVMISPRYEEIDQAMENAEEICLIVNSHGDLYEALEHAMIVLFDVAKTSGLTHSDAISCAIAAQDALAKARGEM